MLLSPLNLVYSNYSLCEIMLESDVVLFQASCLGFTRFGSMNVVDAVLVRTVGIDFKGLKVRPIPLTASKCFVTSAFIGTVTKF